MHPIITAIGLLSHIHVGHHAPKQPVVQDVTAAKQTVVSASDMLNGRVKPSDADMEAVREQKRHNREIEKQLRRMAKNDPFALPQGKGRPLGAVRHISARANAY